MKYHLRCTDVIIAANICRNMKKVTTLMTAGPLWIHLRINLVWAYPSRAPTPKCPESGGQTERQTDQSMCNSRLHLMLCTAVENISALIQLAQCQFPQPAISNAKILIYLSEKKYIAKQFHQTALGNCCGLKLWKCWLQFKKKNYCVIYYNFRHTFVAYAANKSKTKTSADDGFCSLTSMVS